MSITAHATGLEASPEREMGAVRCLGERGFALLLERWKTLRHVTISPRRITDFARVALVLTHFEHGMIG